MITPLIIVAILIVPLGVAQLLDRRGFPVDARFGGVIGLSIAFVFFGVGHFVQTQAMVAMLPPWVPYRTPIVYLTGLLEWLLAIGLLFAGTRRIAGRVGMAVLIVFFSANVYAAFNRVGMGGHVWGPIYLLIRAPLQILLIGWTYWFAVRDRPAV